MATFLEHEDTTQTELVLTAAEFLNNLEHARLRGGSKPLPLPYLMKRIKDVLCELLEVSFNEATVHSPPPGLDVPHTPANEPQPARQEPSGPAIKYNAGSETTSWGSTRERDLEEFVKALDEIASLPEEPVFIDVLYLNSNKGYVIKEFSAVSPGSTASAWILVKSPMDSCILGLEKQNNYVTDILNGLTWDVGIITEEELRSLTSRLFTTDRRNVFVKGLEKKRLVLKKLDIIPSSIYAVEPQPPLTVMRNSYVTFPCPFHSTMDSDFGCARRNAEAIMLHELG